MTRGEGREIDGTLSPKVAAVPLAELHPNWLGHSGREGHTTAGGAFVPDRDQVGVIFDCPKCRDGLCRIPVLFENPPDGRGPVDAPRALWKVCSPAPLAFETLKLSPSILMLSGCRWHGHVGKDVPGLVTTC